MDVGGFVSAGFEPVLHAFEENFAHRDEVGASCSVYAGADLVVNLWGGTGRKDDSRPYTDQTLQMVASASKGALAILVLRLVEHGLLDLDEPVATYWPEFAMQGKGNIPVRWLLSHQAGLPFIDRTLTLDDIIAWQPAVDALVQQNPAWTPGEAHGYHALTYGWLLGEVITRVTGKTPGTVFAEEIAAPLSLDFYVGLPASEVPRVAPLYPPVRPEGAPLDALTLRLLDPNSLTYKAFFVSSGLAAVTNDPRYWQAEVPAANGMATAHALARMYAACLREIDGIRLLSAETLRKAVVPQAAGIDLIAGYETRYGLGFQLPFPIRPMAGEGSFGHYGLGGSVGFAHQDLDFAFGYTVNQMGVSLPADPRSVALIDAVVRCVS